MSTIGTFSTYEVRIEFVPARPRTILRGNVRLDGGAILGASYNGQWLGAYIVPEILFEDVVVVHALVGLDWIGLHRVIYGRSGSVVETAGARKEQGDIDT